MESKKSLPSILSSLLLFPLHLFIQNHSINTKVPARLWEYGCKKKKKTQILVASRRHGLVRKGKYIDGYAKLSVRLFATPWTAACQAPLSMGIL